MTDTTMETSDLLQGVSEIARFLNIKERTAEYWIKKGKLPVRRIGRTIIARRSRLLEALETG
jgi:excisionase family DNA binding protein